MTSAHSRWTPVLARVIGAARRESVAGAVLLLAAVAGLLWANSPWREVYSRLRETTVGTGVLDLEMSVGQWASDGLLAVFFLVIGLELKHEFVRGGLRDPATAAVPIVAAVCGVVTPAIVYTLVTRVGGGNPAGWAVPSATDIAFALAVLAVIGSHLPAALRTFLLTLAVVDDLIAITIIAVFFTTDLRLDWLPVAALGVAAFRRLTARGLTTPWLLAPVALLTWIAVLNSGVHATVAGVLLGLCVPIPRPPAEGAASPPSPLTVTVNERLHHRLQPFSATVCVPVFAFFAAGVTVVGGGWGEAVRDPVTLGVVLGLVVGKTIGVLGSTVAMTRLTRARLDPSLRARHVLGVALLAGIGFTVSLLVAELAFGAESGAHDHATIGVLAGSTISTLLAAAVLRGGSRVGDHRPAAP